MVGCVLYVGPRDSAGGEDLHLSLICAIGVAECGATCSGILLPLSLVFCVYVIPNVVLVTFCDCESSLVSTAELCSRMYSGVDFWAWEFLLTLLAISVSCSAGPG